MNWGGEEIWLHELEVRDEDIALKDAKCTRTEGRIKNRKVVKTLTKSAKTPEDVLSRIPMPEKDTKTMADTKRSACFEDSLKSRPNGVSVAKKEYDPNNNNPILGFMPTIYFSLLC
ncbi:unnamed protein product [Protopolystoma xenopodis]|uniref:Uncharacterized protein n=1 Tax=Protopolystoma xenopodis TaxID=117903 RepID=A0A3S4ZZW1_9PLAT|nr:unnamed protein product [Protopolystoma xenopodis]